MKIFESEFFENSKFHWEFIKRIKKTGISEISHSKYNLIKIVSKNIYKIFLLTQYLFNIK